ncbi:MOSC domain-containing protein [Pannonibacter tanglangensis]|uniref:Molybdenum cofactor sulfurase n=1 Tax=Pannonibacter tanglangensis TaxID=2750084 RepID=A0ABW9ZHC2_9HYPH|nr:MOSC domain-containing protein [Pannonibacter sp. XCT-34]NBN63337.1 molybdenum cofactor sulfurase [Pannonibacter sp. XCT-34]
MADDGKQEREHGFPDGLVRTAGRRIKGTVERVLVTATPADFSTHDVDRLPLTFEGIAGGRHAGFTRRSGGREPWYPRGTEMVNERQISLLSVEELEVVAGRMDLPRVDVAWIGGNILVSGIPHFSLVPPRTRLVFGDGAVLRVDGDNVPCRIAGKGIAAKYPDRAGLDLLFPQKARNRRGLVAFVEKPGIIRPGETVTAHIPEHWLYPKD